jgi:hypothetical protein
MKMHSLATVLGLVLAPSLASAADAKAAEPATADSAGPPATPADTGPSDTASTSKAEASVLINIDVQAASAYVWRGLNLYGEQHNSQTLAVFPSLTAKFGGFSIGYFGGFQLTGDNKTAVVDAGPGAEQDLILKYSGALNDELSYSAGLVVWTYPFADSDVTNTDLLMSIEPGAGVTYASVVDVGFYAGYFRPLQEYNEAISFVYLSPSVGKTVPITADLPLTLSLSAGYKAYTNLPSGADADRAFDLTLNAGTTFPFANMYVTPQVHAAFVTRMDDLDPVTPGNQEAELSDQFVAWAGVNVGYDIGL